MQLNFACLGVASDAYATGVAASPSSPSPFACPFNGPWYRGHKVTTGSNVIDIKEIEIADRHESMYVCCLMQKRMHYNWYTEIGNWAHFTSEIDSPVTEVQSIDV